MLLSERPEPPIKRRGDWKAALSPPLPYGGGFECVAILDELAGELGLLAFQRARDALLWIAVPPHHRHLLFQRFPSAPSVSSGDATADEAFTRLGRLITHPGKASAATVAQACGAISEWAAANSYPKTAIWYAEVAAMAEPRNPQRAWLVGRALRQHAQYDRARQWLERTVGLARREGSRTLQGAAYLSLGTLEFHIGNYRDARRWWTAAWRISRKFHLDHAGPARHNLMRLCMIRGKFGEAEGHAAAAFELYDRSDAGFLGFAHDAAQLWAWQAFFKLAAPLFEAVLPLLQPKEKFIAAANLARAAAGAGDRRRFAAGWDEAEKGITPHNEYVAEGLVSVAEGAQFLGLNTRALELAQRAEEIARDRREPVTLELVAAIKQRVRECAPPPQPLDAPDHVRALAARILRALSS